MVEWSACRLGHLKDPGFDSHRRLAIFQPSPSGGELPTCSPDHCCGKCTKMVDSVPRPFKTNKGRRSPWAIKESASPSSSSDVDNLMEKSTRSFHPVTEASSRELCKLREGDALESLQGE